MEELDEVYEVDDSSSQARRWCFTINNPFGTDIEDIDLHTNILPIKTDYYDNAILEELQQSNLFNFKFVKGKKKISDDGFEEYIYERAFFKDADSAFEYFKSLENFKYVIFSVERGLNEQTEHLQGFIVFNCSRRFRTVRKEMLFHHIEKAKGTNVQCRSYCLKSDTHIAGPYESDGFCEERSRNDIKAFYELIENGATNSDLKKMFPTLYERNINKIHKFKADIANEKYKYSLRDVEVIYIYGNAGVGKSESVYLKHGLQDLFSVDHYDNSMFTGYEFEDTILLDEFTDSLNPQFFNKLLDKGPLHLRGLGTSDYAAYHKVYIVSNYSPKDIYLNLKKSVKDYTVYKAIQRRIHTVIHIMPNGEERVEKVTEWEPCTDERKKKLGLTKQIKCSYEIDENGDKVILYDRYATTPEDMDVLYDASELKEIDDAFGQLKF